MLFPIASDQNVFIEITNPVHGGLGWELGSCLWSPQYDKGGAQAWKSMNRVRPGDVVLHLVDSRGAYFWYAISKASSGMIITDIAPSEPGKWANMHPYQRINIEYFQLLPVRVPVKIIFEQFDQRLRDILLEEHEGMFYVAYGPSAELRMAQRYFATCPQPLYEIFNEIGEGIGFSAKSDEEPYVPTPNEPDNPDYSPPGRVSTKVSRIIRDTMLSKSVKTNNHWRCQICGERILLPTGNYYGEGHHLKPLGGEHLGPDTRDNIIILCPTHHAEFDFGTIAINPVSKMVEHIDPESSFCNQPLAYEREDLNTDFIKYHYQVRFRNV